MIESDPPEARNLAVGCRSTETQDEVWPLREKGMVGSDLEWKIGSNSGYERILILPSPVVTKIFLPLWQNVIWFVCIDC